MTIKYMTSFLLLFCFSFHIYGQKSSEVGLFVGLASYQGDLTESTVDLGEAKFAVGAIYRQNLNRQLAFRANLLVGQLAGTDAGAEDPGRSVRRNLSFESTLLEGSAGVEWFPFRKAHYNETGVYNKQINPFLFAGIGYVRSKSEIDVSKSEDFANIATENTENILVIPFGGGIRYDFAERLSISGEVSWRFTGSDYLEGITGKSENSDWYFFTGLTLNYALSDNLKSDFWQ